MSSWIDKKYISITGSTLRNFKWKSPNLANCSCPLCGDSQLNKLKARMYFVEKEGKYNIFCHNCGASMTFRNFLRTVNAALYDEYSKESFLETIQGKELRKKEIETLNFTPPKFLQPDSILRGLKKISQLKSDHPAKKYVDLRKIPSEKHYRLFYAPKFKTWINTILPNKFDARSDEPRLVIPFLNKQKDVFALQGRSFGKTDPKYYTIILNESYPKIFGLDEVNFEKEYFILEGPLDSFFVNNSLAMAGSDFQADTRLLYQLNTNAVVIYDNEPRNVHIVQKIEKTLKRGLKVVIWPDSITYKDINEMVMNGMTIDDIRFLIKSNIYQDLSGLLRLQKWRKV